MSKNPRLIDLTGRRFERWSVLRKNGNDPRGGALWWCQCACGEGRSVRGADLRHGKSRSCGCLERELTSARCKTHGREPRRLYSAWQNMRVRCADLSDQDYGGRGIAVCAEWSTRFEPFRDWALENGYQADLTLERKDVNGGYSPANCTWADAKAQAQNRRFIKRAPDGRLWSEVARANGITMAAYRSRIYDGWDHAEASVHPMGARRVKRDRGAGGRFV